MKLLIPFVLFIFSINAFSQNVHEAQKNLYLAQYYEHFEEYKKAMAFYEKGLELNPKCDTQYYSSAAALAFQLNKNKLAQTLLEKAIISNGLSIGFIEKNNKLKPYKDRKELQEVVKNYLQLYKQYFVNMPHLDEYFEIQELIVKDQFVRKIPQYKAGISDSQVDEYHNIYFEAIRNKDSIKIRQYEEYIFKNYDTKENPLDWDLINKVDSLNISRFIEITKEIGYEPKSWILLWHHRTTDFNQWPWTELKPLLDKEIEEGKLEKDFYVYFIENLNFIKQQKALYAHEFISANYHLRGIEDVQNLDQRRKEVGLPPYYFYHVINGATLPEGYEYNADNLLEDLMNL